MKRIPIQLVTQNNDLIPYVKLFKNGEIKMPRKLFLTEKSKNILEKGQNGQGFIYFVDLDTGEIHLLAANNPEKKPDAAPVKSSVPYNPDAKLEEMKRLNLIKQESISLTLYELQQKAETCPDLTGLEKQIKNLEDELTRLKSEYLEIKKGLQAIPSQKVTSVAELKVNVPVDRFGKPYDSNEFATTTHEKTSQTGGAGNGDLHANGQRILGLSPDHHLLAGGFWIKWLGNVPGEKLSFVDFRTRSTANTKIVVFNPLHRFIFNMRTDGGNEVGHTQVYLREIPHIYLEPILAVFMQASKDIYLAQANKKQFTVEDIESELLIDVRRSLLLTRVSIPFNYTQLKFVDTSNFLDWGFPPQDIPNQTIFIEKTQNGFKLYWREDNDIVCEEHPSSDIQSDLQSIQARTATQELINTVAGKIISTYQCVPSRSVIPSSTRWHLAIERNWRTSGSIHEQILRIENAILSTNRSMRKIEAESLLRAFVDDGFIENQKLLTDLFGYIETKLNTFSSTMIQVLSDYFNDWAEDQLDCLNHDPKPQEQQSRVDFVNKLFTILPEFDFLKFCKNHRVYKAAVCLARSQANALTTEEICNLIEEIFDAEDESTHLISLLLSHPDISNKKNEIAMVLLSRSDPFELKILKLLLPPSVPISAKKMPDKTLFYKAVINKQYEAVNYFLNLLDPKREEKQEENMLSNYSPYELSGPLLWLVYYNQQETAKQLIKQNPTIDKTADFREDKYTALHICMEMDDPDIDLVHLLCTNNPKAASPNTQGKTPLLIGIEKGHIALVSQLCRESNVLEQYSAQQLCQMIKALADKKQYDLIHLIANQKSNIEIWELIKVIRHEEKEPYHLISLLLSNPDLYDIKNEIAMMLFMSSPDPDIELVRLLCKDNPKVASPNTQGKTPLLIGIEKGHIALVSQLCRESNILDQYSDEQVSQIIKILADKKQHDLIHLLVNKKPSLQISMNALIKLAQFFAKNRTSQQSLASGNREIPDKTKLNKILGIPDAIKSVDKGPSVLNYSIWIDFNKHFDVKLHGPLVKEKLLKGIPNVNLNHYLFYTDLKIPNDPKTYNQFMQNVDKAFEEVNCVIPGVFYGL